MDLYAETILDHYRHPRCKDILSSSSVTHAERNPACGDALTIQLFIEHRCISAIGWSGDGCAISQASMSMLAEHIQQMPIEEVAALRREDIVSMLGVPVGERRIKCALLSLHAVQNSLHTAFNNPLQDWIKTVEKRDK